MKFGDYLRQKRENLNWTQPNASTEIGIEQSYLSKLENNKSVPSEEIFIRLSEVYKFSADEVATQLNSDELRRLNEIAQIRQFVLTQQKKSVGAKRHWLIAGLMLFSIGVAISSLSYGLKDLRKQVFRYESKGVIQPGESDFLYSEMPEMQRMVRMLENSAMKQEIMSNKLFPRLDHKFNISEDYQGEYYDVPLENGKRRYFLRATHSESVKSLFYVTLFSGTLLIAGGLSSFYVSRRW